MLLLARTNPPLHPTLDLVPHCKTCREFHQIHGHLVTTGLLRDPSVASHVVLRLSSSPSLPLRLLARRLFFSLPNPNPNPADPFLWNALIKASSSHFHALLTFSLMLSNGFFADKFSFSLALKACSRIPSLRVGSQIHSLVQKTEQASNLYLQNALIGLYAKCGLCGLARQMFDRIPDKDSVSWNTMIDGYVKNGDLDAAKELFNRMGDLERNLVTWNSMIDGYASDVAGINVARDLFNQMPVRDLVSWNLMIEGYVKCGRLADAEQLFECMLERDVISWANMINGYMDAGIVDKAERLFDTMTMRDVIVWNIMINGYVKNGYFVEALHLFDKMRAEGNVSPDSVTLASALSAISELGRLHDGIAIHEYVKRNYLSLDGKLGVALIDMYSNCGRLDDALQVFEVSGRSVDHYNAMIGGLAIHGHGDKALKLFSEMERFHLKPDDITFIGLLNACSHAGLVKEGLICFETMIKDYGLEPKVQHYGCMVDILGRAGLLEEAWKMIKSMPVEPNDVVWRSLLSSCRTYRNSEMGQKIVRNLIGWGSCNSSSYVLLSNIYASVGMWEDVTAVRMTMRNKDIRKVPGCSWLEVDGVIHEFVVGDNSHVHANQVHSLLEQLYTPKLFISSHVS
ncbi:pentatricopeptide repeat-containing protein At2g45350, chloroplastic isoform X1 [Typha latifolia]|uniref:pentatricopeptide repeat-containing protein At2g45350, chloroplastic isoform X1 n=1 Tax=Typha latifolia TaxID=4733 RepID=UPI003C2BF42F